MVYPLFNLLRVFKMKGLRHIGLKSLAYTMLGQPGFGMSVTSTRRQHGTGSFLLCTLSMVFSRNDVRLNGLHDFGFVVPL